MSTFFTLKELSDHLLDQLLVVDAEYQIRQRLMGAEIKKEFNSFRTSTPELTPDQVAGLGNLNKLYLSEATFSFGIKPVRETIWTRLRRFFTASFPESGHLYRLVGKRTNGTHDFFDVKIAVKRDESGTYTTRIDIPSSITQTPDRVYVSGIT